MKAVKVAQGPFTDETDKSDALETILAAVVKIIYKTGPNTNKIG